MTKVLFRGARSIHRITFRRLTFRRKRFIAKLFHRLTFHRKSFHRTLHFIVFHFIAFIKKVGILALLSEFYLFKIHTPYHSDS